MTKGQELALEIPFRMHYPTILHEPINNSLQFPQSLNNRKKGDIFDKSLMIQLENCSQITKKNQQLNEFVERAVVFLNEGEARTE
mmetsp:Transcript_19510/g.28688  ORF Transcript_19510/g.28688 Transcript_19510/m.28688 type:complete len:85 (-) Transcript_19510:474-728(-)